MTNGLVSIVFGLASALTWGSGDFCGGQATKRSSVLVAITLAEFSGLVVLLVLALVMGEALPSLQHTLWALAAGLAGVIGIGGLYQGLATGSAALVAPVSAVISAVIPVLFAAMTIGLPRVAQLFGCLIALVGIWLIAGEGGLGNQRRGILMALVAGMGFGSYFVCMDFAGKGGGTFWITAVSRAIACVAVVPFFLRAGQSKALPNRAALGLALTAGIFDAAGNAFYVLSGQMGRLDIAAVLASLYPATTVILSRFLLEEHLGTRRIAGIAIVLTAIGLISAN